MADSKINDPENVEISEEYAVKIQVPGSEKVLVLSTSKKQLAEGYDKFCRQMGYDSIDNKNIFLERVNFIVTKNLDRLRTQPSADDLAVVVETDVYEHDIEKAFEDIFGFSGWNDLNEEEKISNMIGMANYFVAYDFQTINENLKGNQIEQRFKVLTALIVKLQEIVDSYEDSDKKKLIMNFILNLLIALNFVRSNYDSQMHQRADYAAKQTAENLNAFDAAIEG